MDKQLEAYRKACHVFDKSPDWATFFREVLGVGGIVRQMYPTPEALAEFKKTPEYAEIHALLLKIREKDLNKTPDSEPTRVITVRLPKSLHETLTKEAKDHATTVNQLCISKLVEWIDGDRILTTKGQGKSKKRKPHEPHEQAEAVAEAG